MVLNPVEQAEFSVPDDWSPSIIVYAVSRCIVYTFLGAVFGSMITSVDTAIVYEPYYSIDTKRPAVR